MKERLRSYYRAIRSVRTSTWVLLVIAIGSNMLYYQVRPDPMVDSNGTRRQPDATVPQTQDSGSDGVTTTVAERPTESTTTVPTTVVTTTPVETTSITSTSERSTGSGENDGSSTTVLDAGGQPPTGAENPGAVNPPSGETESRPG